MIDCGYIQNTDPETLRFLTQRLSKSTAITATEKHPTLLATSPIPWRATNIVYKTNELYVDVIEKVSLTISQEGETLNSEVSGTVTMKCFLSGMPEINIIFNDKIFPEPNDSSTNRFSDIDSVVFHQCVKLLNFSKDRSISFTPPDGEFELMRYRKTRNVGDPFKVLSSVRELPGNKLEVKISIRSMYDVKLNASPLSLTIPLPQNTAEVDVSSTHGKGKYSAEKNAVVWRVQQFPGKAQAEITVNVRYLSASSRAQEATQLREPISAAFNIPMFSASGVTLKNLKIYEKSGYTPEKYLRYTTQAGKYEIKMM
ncbi:Adaptor complexes medium subunit family protein [Histomonas meleagridis]|uniref:Adaptor complexes medium subunit family protein n=1 Tax=Histomonas meleagridis TaxID=135588 RepID=UPI00355A0F22|nr:Adaptor complexes medium subunit family protein [Histomonas meleagridis]KAH0806021.1 Adaptor complexes medium subunit family protein [Histomonas meleagridis]